jgi:CubicO group peptidase (beta-lactamase class C family)
VCLAIAASVTNSIAQTPKARDAEGDREIQKLLSDNNIPLLGLGVIRDGKLQEVRVFGNLRKGVPAPADTIFNVASLTKPVVAMLTLRLVSTGKWSLDEPLDKYWVDPDLKDDPRHKLLTTRHILTHRTGFPNWRWMSKSKKLAFEFEPGSRYQYSGEGFEYLRRALEAKFKRPLESLAKELVLDPLRMSDTRFVWDADMKEDRYAVGYDRRGNMYPVEKGREANAADDLLTTVEDYGTFVVSVMNGDGLTRNVFDEMTSHQHKIKENKYFGLSWAIYDNLDAHGEFALEHGGSDKGVSTEVFLLPKSKQALIIMMNVDEGYRIYEALLIKYLGDLGRRIVEIEMKSP